MTESTIATTASCLLVVEIDTVLVKVASRCNINCSYCYVYNMGDDGWKHMPVLISPDTIQALSSTLAVLSKDQHTPFATVLHGGEPLMLGARRLEYLLNALRKHLGEQYKICMQTNGMLISEEILWICANYKTSISVSLDGPRLTNDRFRVGHKGESSFEKVVAGIRKLRSHPSSEFLFSGLLSVIDPTSNPREIYEFLKGLGPPSLDFLYRDGNHSNLPYGKASFESTEYGAWLCGLLDVYLADPTPVRVRLLDDMMRLTLGGKGVKEGLGISDFGIAIIDTDGTVAKNDTLKSTYRGADRFQDGWSVHTHRLRQVFASPEFSDYHSMQRPTSSVCKSCPDLSVCGGGMPLHRWSDQGRFDNPSVYCNDQKVIINRIRWRLDQEGLVAA